MYRITAIYLVPYRMNNLFWFLLFHSSTADSMQDQVFITLFVRDANLPVNERVYNPIVCVFE